MPDTLNCTTKWWECLQLFNFTVGIFALLDNICKGRILVVYGLLFKSGIGSEGQSSEPAAQPWFKWSVEVC